MKTAWKQITVALSLGFLLGGGFGFWMGERGSPFHGKRSPEERKERLLKKFVSELQLTDSQITDVKKILDSSSDRMGTVRSEMRAKFKAIRGEMKKEIEPLLTEDQRRRFDKMEEEWEARKKRWRGTSP